IHSLIFNTIKLTHAGKYTCQFTEDIKSIGVLQVDEAQTDFDIALQNVTLNEDEPLILECILTKDRPDDQINWLFNGEPLL
ncbi:unnamed protein product, partial [Rotaria magnacalcarata]